jgi:ubiquinone biosynthesis accessory factor UbiJ
MLHSLQALLAPALAERLTLVVNHVLGGETVATDKLRLHAGRTLLLRLQHWPALLPEPPRLAWRITPAGLLEWCGAEPLTLTDLTLDVDASNPALLMARMAGGETPTVQIEGDAQFAGDVNWLVQNLRWDVAADLERLFGPVAAQQLHRAGGALARGLRAAVQAASGLAERLRPDKP